MKSQPLQSLVCTLSREMRAVLVLREAHGLSYDEIAGILQIPRDTVAARLVAARATMLRELRRRDEPSDILDGVMTSEVVQ